MTSVHRLKRGRGMMREHEGVCGVGTERGSDAERQRIFPSFVYAFENVFIAS